MPAYLATITMIIVLLLILNVYWYSSFHISLITHGHDFLGRFTGIAAADPKSTMINFTAIPEPVPMTPANTQAIRQIH